MRKLKLYVYKDKLVCKGEKKGNSTEIFPSITIDANNIVTGIGNASSKAGGITFWPLKAHTLSSQDSAMFAEIVKHVLYEHDLSYGWRRFLLFAPTLEVHLAEELKYLNVWFEAKKQELGVRSLVV